MAPVTTAAKDEIKWDGVVYPYIPAPDWKSRIDPSVQLHTEAADDIDPITFEVLRYSLWHMTLEIGDTMRDVSGSPIANIGEDFNPVLLTEDGEEVLHGPYIIYLPFASAAGARWVLENRSANPGIREGDIFLGNDPWVCCNHQMDVSVMCPVFWEGKIFSWVCCGLHQYDIGGVKPGSFVSEATNVFDEPVPQPPYRIVEKYELRRDLEELFVRHSRLPALAALDLRAQIAGLWAGERRIKDLLRRYGAPVVKKAMRKILDDTEAVFVRRLREIPDGKWTDVSYLEVAGIGDRHVYKSVLTATKEGDKLIFDNDGTAPQVQGSLNGAFHAWHGNIMGGLLYQFGFDQMFTLGGPMRRCEMRPVPGTLTCPTYPAAVACGPAFAAINTLAQAHRVFARMAALSPELKPELYCGSSGSTAPCTTLHGVNQFGEPFGTILMDLVTGGIGAFSWRDGLDTAGQAYAPRNHLPNIEHNERNYPILYLYRKTCLDSGGAGTYRGGNTHSFAYKIQAVEQMGLDTATTGQAIPTSIGMAGALPASPSRHILAVGTDVQRRLAEGYLPSDIAESCSTASSVVHIPGKSKGTILGPDDVYEETMPGSPGYGDPLQRETSLVEMDVVSGDVSREHAFDAYGVVVTPELAVDVKATEQRRADVRALRLREGKQWTASHPEADSAVVSFPADLLPRLPLRFHEYLEIADVSSRLVVRCVQCATEICEPGANHKLHLLYVDRNLWEVGTRANDPREFIDDPVVLREFFCPGCALQIDTEIARPTDAPYRDIVLTV